MCSAQQESVFKFLYGKLVPFLLLVDELMGLLDAVVPGDLLRSDVVKAGSEFS